jgi:hypothetical protein
MSSFRNETGTEGEVSRASVRAQSEAERRYPVRVRIAVPPEGLGRQLALIYAWLDETCGPEGWATAPAGLAGVSNDAIAFYFDEAAFAHAFVARFCCGYRVETIARAFAVRRETPARPCPAAAHKTP